MSRANEPAYPVANVHTDRDGEIATRIEGGLTIREHFAAMALQGILSCFQEYGATLGEGTPEKRAAQAVKHADALLRELEKRG